MFSGISLIGVVRIQSKAILEPRTTFSDSFLVEHEKKIYIVKRNKNSYKVFGSALLDDYSVGLDRLFNIAKIGGVSTFLLIIAVYALGITLVK